MALQKIDWGQIDTQNLPLDTSGSKSLVILGDPIENQLEAVYARNLFISGVSVEEIIEINSGIFRKTGSFFATTNELQVTGSMIIKGDLRVEGTTTLVQTLDNNIESLIVSGAMSIVRNEINSQIASASLTIQNLGTLGDRSLSSIIDCGDGFF